MITLKEIKENAKKNLTKCYSCDICDGRACKNLIPGPGSKGSGEGAYKNYIAWNKIELEMDTIVESGAIDTTYKFFGKKFDMPLFAGPIGNLKDHYSDFYTDKEYNDVLVHGCKLAGICAFTGDGINDKLLEDAVHAIKNNDGIGIPTIKPWSIEKINSKINASLNANVLSIAMDVDSIGLPFLISEDGVVNSLSKEKLSEIIKKVNIPFIVKGIMNVKTAKKAIEAGASGIVVSNHGGRVLDSTPSTCSVLKEISDYCKGKCTVLVDGGIRSGRDIFKALALGAEAVIIARPFVQMIYGAKEDGIIAYVNSLKAELKDAMLMCGARKLSDICIDMIRINES